MLLRVLLALFVALVASTNVAAQNFGLSELRVGVMAHSVDEPGPGGAFINVTRWEDVAFEALFHSPEIDAFRWIGSPRPHIGATINLAGRESMVRLGLTWQAQIFDSDFFVEGTFGAALHNGAFTGAVAPARNLGCALHFYEAVGVGVNVTDNMTAMVSLEHASSANICMPNRGLTNLGFKVGYKF